jgi:hypothetical protein
MATQAQPIPPPLDQKRANELQVKGTRTLEQAQTLTIVDADDYTASGSLLQQIAEWQKQVNDFFETPVKAANTLHKWLTGQRRNALLPFEQAENLLKARRMEFRRIQDEEDRKRQEEARALAKKQEDDEALRQAAELERMGETEAAQTIFERQVDAPPPPVILPSSIPKQTGISTRKIFRYRVKDLDKVKREFMIQDDEKIGPIVKKLGRDAEGIIGGIEVYEEEIEAVRRANG